MMFRTRAALPALALSVLAACKSDGGSSVLGPPSQKFSATLTGASTVPAATTTASGIASFETVGDTAISFTLEVTGITGVTQGHLHSGVAGANGTTLVWLLPVNGTSGQTPSVPLTGVIGTGTIVQSWIRGGTPISLDSLKSLMKSGKAYVDVHTSTLPAGELRGQTGPSN
jgi:hypothetical protein